MLAPPPTLQLGAQVGKGVALLASAASASLVIVDDGGIPRGVLTEQDVVRCAGDQELPGPAGSAQARPA